MGASPSVAMVSKTGLVLGGCKGECLFCIIYYAQHQKSKSPKTCYVVESRALYFRWLLGGWVSKGTKTHYKTCVPQVKRVVKKVNFMM